MQADQEVEGEVDTGDAAGDELADVQDGETVEPVDELADVADGEQADVVKQTEDVDSDPAEIIADNDELIEAAADGKVWTLDDIYDFTYTADIDPQFDNKIMPLFNEDIQDVINATSCMIQIHWLRPFKTVSDTYDLEIMQGFRKEYEMTGYYNIVRYENTDQVDKGQFEVYVKVGAIYGITQISYFALALLTSFYFIS